jgi:hypothetical protein
MAIVKSVQLTNAESTPVVQNPARDYDARVRMAYFSFFPTSEASGSTIRLGTLRAGWRIVKMEAAWPIIGATSATLSLGVSGTVAKYMAATALDAASAANKQAAETSALFKGEALAADTELIGTTAGAALLTSTTNALQVFVYYTRD